MNKFKTAYYFCLVMLLIWQPFEAASQSESFSLEECKTHALANNYTFKIQALKVKQAEKNKTAQATRFLPQLDGYFNHQYTFGSAIDPNTNSRVAANFQYDNVGINARIDLFNFAELWDSKLQSKDIDIENAKSLVVEQEYMLTLVEKFYLALGTQEWLKVLRQQIKNTELQLERINNEVQTGLKPESDIYDIQVIYTQEKKTLIALEQDEINKKNDLFQWMNYSSSDTEKINLIHHSIKEQIEPTINIGRNVQIEFEKRRKEKLEFEHTQLLSRFLPRLSLDYAYSTFFSQKIENISNTSLNFGNQLQNNKSQYLGLGVRIPIYSRGDNARLRTKKKIEINEQNLQVEKVMLDQKNIHDNYYRKLQQYHKMEDILNDALDYAEKSLETTQTKYTFGKVDISAYKMAKNQVLISSYDIINNNLSIYMSEQLLLVLNNTH